MVLREVGCVCARARACVPMRVYVFMCAYACVWVYVCVCVVREVGRVRVCVLVRTHARLYVRVMRVCYHGINMTGNLCRLRDTGRV